ncbi:hypothetical protein AYI70_g3636 [Smittium culicis]|uniref:Uncharacterized protein n=1 Tax=Smittium culicis TaxID=133412 RepID=A0A1R1Y2Z3_9FUNG|nr:hypothetical protein AYI70_g3636 [Smittium culicis]
MFIYSSLFKTSFSKSSGSLPGTHVVGRFNSVPYSILAGLIPVELLFMLRIESRAFHRKQSQSLELSSINFDNAFFNVLFSLSTWPLACGRTSVCY